MASCPKCGTEVMQGGTFCQQCGTKVGAQPAASLQPPSSRSIAQEDHAKFIGNNALKYLTTFKKFGVSNGGQFSLTWHWPAFFVPFFWLLYRKLYLWAVLVFFLSLPIVTVPFIMLAFGMSANYLYFKHTRKKVAELMAAFPSDAGHRSLELVRLGGVNIVAVLLPAIVLPIAVFFIGIIAAIAIPQFHAYRQRAYEMQAKTEVTNACQAAAALFLEDPGKKVITMGDLKENGFAASPGIEVVVLNGRRERLQMTGRHLSGEKVFRADNQCNITEEMQQQQ